MCMCLLATQMCDMDRLYEICDKHGLTVVEDCAHALGVNWRGTQLGNRAKVRFIQLQLRSFVKREVVLDSRWEDVKPCFKVFSTAASSRDTITDLHRPYRFELWRFSGFLFHPCSSLPSEVHDGIRRSKCE